MQIIAGTQEVWPRLPEAMKAAIIKEVNLGNTLDGASLQWPEPSITVLVTLSKPFLTSHTGYKSYNEDTNPHYRDWLGKTYIFESNALLASPY